MARRLGELYGTVFARAMERDVPPEERVQLRHLLDDLSGDIRATHSSRQRPRRRGAFADLICEAIDERLHGREED